MSSTVLFFLREINRFLETLSSFCIFEKALFLDPRDSILETRDSILETRSSNVSSIEARGSSLEVRVSSVNLLLSGTVSDLRIDLDITDSYNIIAKTIEKSNFLIWAGLRLAIPQHLKLNLRANDHTFLTMPPSMIISNNDFNILTKKSKDYYALLISRRAQLSKNALVLKNDFNLTEDQLEKVFLLPHIVCFESYVKAFQYKVLNSILYTNFKLCKIGYIADDKCTFCKSESETLIHLFFNYVYSKLFWKDFEFYYYSVSNELLHLSLQDVLIGIIAVQCPLLNYFLLIAKLYLWDCRRSQVRPTIAGFKTKIKLKFETEKYICTKNKTLKEFYQKWALSFTVY